MSEPDATLSPRPADLLDLPQGAIVYRDASLLIVDKPAGIPCQSPGPAQPEDLVSLLKRRVAMAQQRPEHEIYLGTHQRLDQETSGVLLYSLDKSVNPALAEQFQSRRVDKRYVAAVSGQPPAAGTLLESYLVPADGGRMRLGHVGEQGAKLARTRVLEVEQVGDRSLLTLAIETGRTHQIRVQLAAAGCPVAGDALYGGAPALRLLLHARRVALEHPKSGAPLAVEAPLPYELRCWLGGSAEPVFSDSALLRRSVELAAARRASLLRAYADGETTAFRLLHGAADGVDDVYIDVYDRWLVVRVDGDGREAAERALFEVLRGLGFAGAYVKRHPRQANQIVDAKAGQFAPADPVWGRAAPQPLVVYEHGVGFEVRLDDGLRTGLFLDQRDNRACVRELAHSRRVLNLFGYTGSFSVVALVGGARSATTVDVSRTALAWAERNVARVCAGDQHRSIAEDAFVALRSLRARGERFELVILDPPSYSTSKHGRFRVTKDYSALCAAALRVMAPGGIMIACVNHHGLTRASLRRFIQSAGREAGVAFESMRDLPVQRDFPTTGQGEPAMKSVIVRLAVRPGMRSASAGMSRRKWSG